MKRDGDLQPIELLANAKNVSRFGFKKGFFYFGLGRENKIFTRASLCGLFRDFLRSMYGGIGGAISSREDPDVGKRGQPRGL